MDHEERLKAALSDRYQIEREIGSGGMATVYLAQDLKHDRKVAVKVLKPELAAVVGTDRFLAEIRTTANLSHPNILPLFDSGEADGFLFYVMPYVEGESLRARLERESQLPVEEALRIAGRVADALDSAHRHNVIHRDIKPANILFQEGEPVVADFGIALAVSAAGEGRLTETGLSLGTPYYMSPEQAAGEETPTGDSDVYSLGCVLYEMLTGEPPHTGATAQAILGKIFLGEVTPPTKLRRTIPVNVEAAVLKALERIPADRFGSGEQFTAALQDKGFRHGAGVGEATAAGPWKMVATGLGAAAILSVALALKLAFTPEHPPPTFLQQEIRLPEYSSRGVWEWRFALAPDGSSYVYADTSGLESGWRLWVKERREVEARVLSGTEGARTVTYSPEGDWIAFIAGSELHTRPIYGEGTRPLVAGVDPNLAGLSWLDDGTILCELEGNTLVRIPDGGGAVDTISVFSDEVHRVRGLPGSAGALIVSGSSQVGGNWTLRVANLQDGTVRELLEGVNPVDAWYAATGHLVWIQRDGSVFAAPFDPEKLDEPGDHEPLFGGVTPGVFTPGIVMGRDGTVVYRKGGINPFEYDLVWVDRRGEVEEIETSFQGLVMSPALSPDGTRLAVQVNREGRREIWTTRTDRPSPRPLSSGSGLNPAWIPGESSVSYISLRGEETDLWTRGVDESGEAEPLPHPGLILWDVVWSHDGSWVVAGTSPDAEGLGDIVAWRPGPTPEPVPLVATGGREGSPSLSPNGRFLAYVSNESGRRQVYVRPFPGPESWTLQVSIGDGIGPVWAKDGRELFYRRISSQQVVAVEVDTESGPRIVIGEEQVLFSGPYMSSPLHPAYDVSPDGQRFLMLRLRPAEEESRMIMILNLLTELDDRVGDGR